MSSIIRLHPCFQLVPSSGVKSILREHNFYHNLETLILILKPIKETISVLEADTTSLALQYVDCFNKIWAGFEYSSYLLTFFLHPYYREQLKKYKLKKSPYNEPYVLKHSNPLKWLYVCEEGWHG
nr:9442_t:CDS:2 [Entrophospora candida]